MKRIITSVFIAGMLMAFPSCKETADGEHTHEDGTTHSHEDDMDDHDHDSEEHSHDDGTTHSHDDHDGKDHDHDDAKIKSVVINMSPKSGSNVMGKITLTQSGEEVTMVANLNGLTEGEHAIHIHQNGDCSSDDGKSAGGHWNPTEEAHGQWGDDMHHSGDIGNLKADGKGNASLSFATDMWCIGCDDDTKNVIGKSFIVHAKADDFESQPSGAAGERVACGVIEM